MMQAIRSRAGSIVVKTLFGLLIISFGFWGLYTRSDLFDEKSPGAVVAKVGSEDIRADQLQQELQPALERLRAQFGGTIDTQQIKQLGIVDSLLGQLIDRRLLDQEGARLGLEVSDEVVRSTIYDNPAFRGPDGKFDRQMFSQILMMNHLTEEQLVARLRNDIPRADLLQSITSRRQRAATGSRGAVSLSQRKTGRRHRHVSGRGDHRYRPAERCRPDQILRGAP